MKKKKNYVWGLAGGLAGGPQDPGGGGGGRRGGGGGGGGGGEGPQNKWQNLVVIILERLSLFTNGESEILNLGEKLKVRKMSLSSIAVLHYDSNRLKCNDFLLQKLTFINFP